MLNITVICEKVGIFKHCPLSFLSGSWNWTDTTAELITEEAEAAEQCGTDSPGWEVQWPGASSAHRLLTGHQSAS